MCLAFILLRLDAIWHTSGVVPLLCLSSLLYQHTIPVMAQLKQTTGLKLPKRRLADKFANMGHNPAGCVLGSRILSMSQAHVWDILTIGRGFILV